MPRPPGMRLAASYVNFYIAHGGIVAPAFNDKWDQEACNVLKELFPDREVQSICLLFFSVEIGFRVLSQMVLLNFNLLHFISSNYHSGGNQVAPPFFFFFLSTRGRTRTTLTK